MRGSILTQMPKINDTSFFNALNTFDVDLEWIFS